MQLPNTSSSPPLDRLAADGRPCANLPERDFAPAYLNSFNRFHSGSGISLRSTIIMAPSPIRVATGGGHGLKKHPRAEV